MLAGPFPRVSERPGNLGRSLGLVLDDRALDDCEAAIFFVVCGFVLSDERAARVAAQPPGKIYRIVVLATIVRPPAVETAMLSELARRGFVEGRNLILEPRVGPPERLPDMARELVESHPDVILAVGLVPARAARAATQSVPIIAVSSFPVEAGLVANLARPGGNLSGVSIFTAELNLKRLAILHELVPGARRIVLLRDPPYAPPEHIAALEATARDLGVTVGVIDTRRPEEIADAVRRARADGAEAVNVLASPMFAASDLLAAAAIEAGLPAICQWFESAEAGCFASYGPTLAEVFRTAASHLALVLQGARVAELPVQQPTEFELVINLQTAKALGLTVPPSMLARAERVLE
jgi:putative ABC transport system substrate-binding protein